MTATVLLDLKQRLAKLSESERRQISAYLLRLKHESPAWKKEISARHDRNGQRTEGPVGRISPTIGTCLSLSLTIRF